MKIFSFWSLYYLKYAQIIFSINTLFAIFGTQQDLKLGGLGIRNCQCVQSFSCLAKPPHIPAIKSHLSAEDSRAWHSCFISPNHRTLAPHRLLVLYQSSRKWVWIERKDKGGRVWREGILFAVAPHPLLIHPPWGYWTLWISWFVLRVTKHDTWMFISTMTKLERAKNTWWWDGPWTSQVPCSVLSPLDTGLWLDCSFNCVDSPTSLNTLYISASQYRTIVQSCYC